MPRFYGPTLFLRKKPRDCGKARNIPRESSAKRKRNSHEPLARLMLSEELKFGSACCARYTARETSVSRGKIRRRVSVKILLAIDGSTDSDAAVDEVARLPWPPDSEVKVLTCTSS